MAQVQVRLGAVIQHIDFSVLIRVHGAGIDIEIRIKFLESDLESRFSSSVARAAAVRPLPKELTTPPVTKTYFIFRG